MAADGEVTYEIRGDDSNLDRDLDAAQKKVEQSAKKGAEKTEQIEKDTSESVKKTKEDVTEHHQEQNEKRVKDDEETGKKREEVERSTGEKLKSLAGTSAKAIGAGMLVAGTAAIAVGGMAINSATQMDQAMNQYIASTGKGTEETERYQGVLENIYKNNYGEDFQDIASAMADVDKQLGDMSDEQLQQVTESAFALRDTFGYEIPESTRAAKAMMDNFGISGEDAMSLIAAGAQNGLDYSGELIDSISEYSVQFSKLGFNADDMFKIFQKGADSGAFNLDKVGDAVKEFSIRAIDGSATTIDGFTKIGLNADEMAKKFSEGGDSAKEAFQETISALADMEDPLAQNTAGVDLFGTMWEDLGPEAVEALAGITDGAYDTADAMNGIKEVKYDDLGSMLEGLKRSLEMLLIPLGEQLIPVLNELIQAVLPMLEEALPPLMDLISQLIEQLAPLIAEALPPLVDLFGQLVEQLLPIVQQIAPILIDLFNELLPPLMELISAVLPVLVDLFAALIPPIAEIISTILPVLVELIQSLLPVINLLIDVVKLLLSAFLEVFKGIAELVSEQIENITTIFDNLIDFVKNVFTGNWKGAWENVKNIFKAVADSLAGLWKAPMNAIIDLINGFLKGLGNIEIPDWVPVVGGNSFTMPTIPRLKTGIDFVPGDYFPAYLDYGERVLTQEENVRFNAMGGLSGMEAVLSQGNYSHDQKIVLGKGCIVVQSNVDGKTIAQATAPYMDTELGTVTDTKGRSK